MITEPVSINGISLPPEDFQTIVKELDNRRRHYHVRARDAKNAGIQQSESRKAGRLDELLKLIAYATGTADPSDERLDERRQAKAREKQHRHRHRVSP